jgi:crotonobetainyl-CoA:carnitine CoA-transferase CaiB-like acyl-CoA transferase
MLADLGADVVLVEPPAGSRLRRQPPLVPTATGSASAYFAFTGAGKRSVTLALDRVDVPAVREVRERLVDWADVFVTDADVGELETLALGADALCAANPRLVYASLTPFGLTGPRRRWRGADIVGWAASGALPTIGDPDRAPLAPGGRLASMTGALNTAVGVMAALSARLQSGRGQLVDISLQESVISVAMEAGPMVVLEGGFTQPRTGKRKPGAPIGHYATKDGAVSVVAYMPEHWRALADWIREETGVEEITAEEFAGTPIARTHYGELIDGWIEGLTMRYSKQAFFEEAQRRGITVTAVNSAADVLDDPHLRAGDGLTEVVDPELGPLRAPTPPIRIDGVAAPTLPAPRVGEHTDAILTKLGFDTDEIARMRAAGAV